MPITHVNRKGQTYYLHQGTTKTGKPKYHFSMKTEGHLVETIPEGFEVYENPHAQVFLRRIQTKIITDVEIATVKRAMKKQSDLVYYQIDVKKNVITVFVSDQDVDALMDILSSVRPGQEEHLRGLLMSSLSYSPVLRFILEDEDKRVFVTERYCYLGSIDDWMEIGDPGRLSTLAERYIPHLGRDSYYSLF